MAFKMRSGNTTSFKMMGSSPLKDEKSVDSGEGKKHSPRFHGLSEERIKEIRDKEMLREGADPEWLEEGGLTQAEANRRNAEINRKNQAKYDKMRAEYDKELLEDVRMEHMHNPGKGDKPLYTLGTDELGEVPEGKKEYWWKRLTK